MDLLQLPFYHIPFKVWALHFCYASRSCIFKHQTYRHKFSENSLNENEEDESLESS